ncbi:MAG: SDR family oxidoreductase [Chloroflexi bacterium]|nr:SDR family oxidoreductase [Chloroflexota bacterium]
MRATALLLASRGATVLILGRHEQDFQRTVQAIRNSGGEAIGVAVKACSVDDVEQIVDEVEGYLGSIDILVNNVDLAVEGQASAAGKTDTRALLAGCAGEIICRMKDHGKGHIINVRAGDMGKALSGQPGVVASANSLPASLRRELTQLGIKVTIVEPDTFDDPIVLETDTQPRLPRNGAALLARNIAEGVYYSVTQSRRVDVVLV